MKKHNIAAQVLLATALLASCTAWDDTRLFSPERPGTDAQYEYLNAYGDLKSYVNRATHPLFKAGIAIEAPDYNEGKVVYALANSNFDEVVAGNAMKMASCINDKGGCDFSKVEKFVDNATEAGTSVYGHTLAWHSQQPVKWLTSLIADKELPGGEEKVVEDYDLDCNTLTKTDWEQMPATTSVIWRTGNGFVIDNTVAIPNFWELQYWLVAGIGLQQDQVYTITFNMKAEGSDPSAKVRFKLGDWNNGGMQDLDIPTGMDYADYTLKVSAPIASCGLFFQHGDFEGKLYFKSIRITHVEKKAAEEPVYLYDNDFKTSGEAPGGWATNTREVVNEGGEQCIRIHNNNAGGYWEEQMAVDYAVPFTDGKVYYIDMRIKGSGDGLWRNGFQILDGWKSAGDFPNLPFSTDWTTYKEKKVTCSGEGATRWVHSFGDFAGDIYISDLKLYYMKSLNTEPLTPQDKKDTLAWAMDYWVKNMMQATKGRVKAWDLINEAVSGADRDGDGIYDLQHASDAGSGSWDVGGDAFFWQDYLGDIDYAVIVSKAAQKHFAEAGGNPDELKLFINDYNLEAVWDNCKKTESLIEWIKRWKAAGAKIDGIGTQMHISYYRDPVDQENQKKCITRMFQLMAQSGLLCRVSELDMGIADKLFAPGSKTSDMTFEEEKAMADYYQWIIEEYFRIIPPAQQYGITQWCVTDAPASSGWRPGEPVGLWTIDYKRKPAYGGWAEGLRK